MEEGSVTSPTRNSIPVEDELPQEMRRAIANLGRFWAGYPNRPRPTQDVSSHWEKLISDWTNEDSLPLYVRKQTLGRGSVLPHSSGRRLIPTDNSPAKWSFALACRGDKPSLSDIAELIGKDRIPVTMALTSREKENVKYRCTLRELQRDIPGPSTRWKLGHIDDVGLKVQGSPDNLDIAILREHFIRLMTPSNMFVVPKKYAGLAELPEFYQQMK
jgi:hypothetical protein